MTDKQFKRLRDRIKRIALPWIETLGLKWWNIELEYSRDGKDMLSRQEESGAVWDCMATASAKWEYLSATVRFNMPTLMDCSDESLEKTILHELCHILVREMREWSPEDVSQERIVMGRRAEERVVCTLARAFLWTRSRSRKESKE